MTTTTQYEKILDDLAAGELTTLARSVFGLLKRIPGGCTRLQLIEYCYGPEAASKAAKRGLSNSEEDRKIREAIEFMRDNMIPIVATSGRAGYRLETDTALIREMVGEWKTRIAKMQARVTSWENRWPEIREGAAQTAQPVTIPELATQAPLFPAQFRGMP